MYKGFVFVPFHNCEMYNNYLAKDIDQELELFKLLDNSRNLETALDTDFIWAKKSFIVEGDWGVLDYNTGYIKDIALKYPQYAIVLWSLYDNTDFTSYFQHRTQGEIVRTGDALFTITQLCTTYKIDPTRFHFVSPGIYKNKNYPNFKYGTADFHYISTHDEPWENIEQSPEELMESKNKLFNLLHMVWKPSRSLFMFLADKQIKGFTDNNNINYWTNFNFSGSFAKHTTADILNQAKKFDVKLLLDHFNEATLMNTYKHDNIGRDIVQARSRMDGEIMYSTYINISISGEPDKSNVGIENQVFKSAIYMSPSLQIGSQRQMRKFNGHYGLDLFEDLWDLGGGLSSYENLNTSFERIVGAVELVKKLDKNKKQVIAWFKDEKNIARLRYNRNKVIQLLRKNATITMNENEALHFLEAFDYV